MVKWPRLMQAQGLCVHKRPPCGGVGCKKNLVRKREGGGGRERTFQPRGFCAKFQLVPKKEFSGRGRGRVIRRI